MIDLCFRALRQYTDFKGRAKRSQFWAFYGFHLCLILFLIILLLFSFPKLRLFELLLVLILLLPYIPVVIGLAVSVRRLHDTGRSGLWILIGFVNFVIPFAGIIVLLILMSMPSEKGDNKYGEQPL